MRALIAKRHEQVLWPVRLDYSGQVLVGIGDQVEEGQAVAEISLPECFQVFDLVNSFRIHPAEADKYLARLVGESVEAGDLIAEKPGLVARIFRAPAAGRVVSIRDGKVTLALGERKLQALAPFPGEVVELIPGRGAVIAMHASLLQGLWGNGRNAKGTLVAWTDSSPISVDEKLVYFEVLPSLKGIRRVVEGGAAGLVFPSILPEHLDYLRQLPIAVISLAGFGDLNLDSISLELARAMLANPAVPVYLMAAAPDGGSEKRPELIQAVSGGQGQPAFTLVRAFRPGSKVRLSGRPYSGILAEVVELPQLPLRFASGLELMPAIVRTADGQELTVPIDNLDLIET